MITRPGQGTIGRHLRMIRLDDRGSLAAPLLIVMLLLFIIGGLGVDGSRIFILRGQAQAYAEEAARAGATAISLVNAKPTLDKDVALHRATEYCDAIRAANAAQVVQCAPEPEIDVVGPGDPRRLVVVVNVELRTKTSLLSMFGIQELSAKGSARARAYEGLNGGDAN